MITNNEYLFNFLFLMLYLISFTDESLFIVYFQLKYSLKKYFSYCIENIIGLYLILKILYKQL
jgi:beta-lactamase regulating signal transducer with metallopeptidase domain